MAAIVARVGSGSIIAVSLPALEPKDEPALAAIRSGRFYAWDGTPRSHPATLRVPAAGTPAVAAGRLAQVVHPPDLAERPAVGSRRHSGAGQANRHGGIAYPRTRAGERLPDLPWRAQPRRVVVARRGRLAAAPAGRHFPRCRCHCGDWDRRHYRAPLGSENQRTRHLSGPRPFFERALRQNQWSALAVRATARPHTLGRPHHGPAVSHCACPVQALLRRQAALAQDAAGLGPPGRVANPPLAARPPYRL